MVTFSKNMGASYLSIDFDTHQNDLGAKAQKYHLPLATFSHSHDVANDEVILYLPGGETVRVTADITNYASAQAIDDALIAFKENV